MNTARALVNQKLYWWAMVIYYTIFEPSTNCFPVDTCCQYSYVVVFIYAYAIQKL